MQQEDERIAEGGMRIAESAAYIPMGLPVYDVHQGVHASEVQCAPNLVVGDAEVWSAADHVAGEILRRIEWIVVWIELVIRTERNRGRVVEAGGQPGSAGLALRAGHEIRCEQRGGVGAPVPVVQRQQRIH